jgi:lysine 2,3-aminomutase
MARYITNIDKIPQLNEEERVRLKTVAEKFAFRVNDYYLKLIDWNDPHDPIRKLVIPSENELVEYGKWDASDEVLNYVAPGCQHKYDKTALLLVSEVCGAYCRYCFRKRLFRHDVKEASTDLAPGVEYIKNHPEINNVLLTGGDPLILDSQRIQSILDRLSEIKHLEIVRFGSKMPVFDPIRIYEDKELLETLKSFSLTGKKIYIINHINHPREITSEAMRCFHALHESGAILVNQTPIMRGINDNGEVLGELLNKLAWAGVTPYYFFVNRPVAGNADFVLPLNQVYQLVEEAKSKASGLGKRVRLFMSHSSGKIEIMAIEEKTAYLKYHQSKEGHYGKMKMLLVLIQRYLPRISWIG